MTQYTFREAKCGCIVRMPDSVQLRYCSKPEHGRGLAGLKMRRGGLRGGPTAPGSLTQAMLVIGKGPTEALRRMPVYERKKAARERARDLALAFASGAYRSEHRNWLRGYGCDYGPAKQRKGK